MGSCTWWRSSTDTTRKVLAWRISNTLEADFCVEALNETMTKYGMPEIMNTDQGSQFTSFAWTDRLRQSGVRISMDGKGRFLDNIFVKRLWRSLKYECAYLHAWETGSDARDRIAKWIDFIIKNAHTAPMAAARYGVLARERKHANRSAGDESSLNYVQTCPNIGE